MPSPAVIEIAPLLEPIPGDQSAGTENIPWATRDLLSKAREEDDPARYSADDPDRPKEAKFANWNRVLEITTKLLKETTKHLEVSIDVTEALLEKHGSAGLRDGLRLIRQMTEECWERMQPPYQEKDDNGNIISTDYEMRTSRYERLDGFCKRQGSNERPLNIPEAIRAMPMVIVRDPINKDITKKISWRDWEKISAANNPDVAAQKAEFNKALLAMEAADIHNVKDDLDESVAEVTKLIGLLNEKIGADAPAFNGLRKALLEVKKSVDGLAEGKQLEAPVTPVAVPTEGGGTVMMTPGAVAPTVLTAASRAEVYKQLTFFATKLKDLEPHSPIPYLIERAVRLGAMPWPELLKNLVRNGDVVTELYREFGIHEQPAQEGQAPSTGW